MVRGNEEHNHCITVNGVMSSSRLGFCLAHEHLFIDGGQLGWTDPMLSIDDFHLTGLEVAQYKKSGGSAIVDAQPVGCGRMEKNLMRLSESAGIHIIASTGFHRLVHYPARHWIRGLSEDGLTRLFIEEISAGMRQCANGNLLPDRIKARAGVIKSAADERGITDRSMPFFHAAAQAAASTGAAVMCHTQMGEKAIETLDFFVSEGLRPDQVILCHLDRIIRDLDYYTDVLQTGAYIECDTIGRSKYHSDEEEAVLLARLFDARYGDRILLGHDTTRSRMVSYGGGIGLAYIHDSFLPLLRRHGFSDSEINAMCVDNPSRAFSVTPPLSGN